VIVSETQADVATEMLEYERLQLISAADLLHRRLGKLIERGHEGMGFDLPTIISLTHRLRDAIEAYRTAQAVHAAVTDAPH